MSAFSFNVYCRMLWSVDISIQGLNENMHNIWDAEAGDEHEHDDYECD